MSVNSSPWGGGAGALQLVMSEELQSIVAFMLQMTSFLTDMIGRLGPVVEQVQGFMTSIDNLNLVADPAFRNVSPLGHVHTRTHTFTHSHVHAHVHTFIFMHDSCINAFMHAFLYVLFCSRVT